MEFVFIIGIARTGSKIYKNILNKYSEINILNELNYFAPKWIRKDFRFFIEKKLGNIKNKNDILNLINLMYNGTFNGTFWTTKKWKVPGIQNSIIGIDKEKLKNELLKSNMTYKDIFRVLIEQHTIARYKKIGGAKFPVDIYYVPDLIKWFPNSKFVHIIRDPRAIYSSMILKDKRNFSNLTKLYEYSINTKRLFYLWLQYKQAVKVHRKYRNMNNYYISRFEDIVNNPEKNLKKLCNFLNIDFKEDMLYPPVVASSYGKSKQIKGFDEKTLFRWKKNISPISEALIKLLLKNEMKEMGYL